MMRLTFFASVFVFVLCSAAFASVFSGRVAGVTDGNNITVNINGQDVPVRLYCVDAPPPGQSFGNEAKEYVTFLAMGRDARIEVMDSDHSNRLISRVMVEGKDLSTELVKAGLAWYDNRRSHDPALAGAHKKARSSGIGIWSEEDPEAPWVFRRKSRGISPDFSVGYCGAPPASSLPVAGNGAVSTVRKDYGFVPVSDQTCESSFGITVFSVPSLWPCYYPWSYGGFYGGQYGVSYGGSYGISMGSPGGGLYISTSGINPYYYGSFYRPSRPCSSGCWSRPPCGTGSQPPGSWGRPPCGPGSCHQGNYHR